MEFRSPCSLASPNALTAAICLSGEPFDNTQGDEIMVSPISIRKVKHCAYFGMSVDLHRSQCLNDIQTSCSKRPQKTTEECHEQGKTQRRYDDGWGKSEGKRQFGERVEVQSRNGEKL